MKITNLYFKKNDKAADELRLKGATKLPYFKIALPPQQDGGEWIEVGAAWRDKSGRGYNFRTNKDIELELTELTSDGTPMPNFDSKQAADEFSFD